MVLDDPHNVIKIDSMGVMEKTIAFFRTSMLNRLNDMARSAIVVVMQRLSETNVSYRRVWTAIKKRCKAVDSRLAASRLHIHDANPDSAY